MYHDKQSHEDTITRERSVKNKNPRLSKVSRGGLVPAALLARELGIRHVDTVCISSYDHDHQRDLKILKKAEGDGEGFIVVDDLVDTGGTAKVIREMYPKAHFGWVY